MYTCSFPLRLQDIEYSSLGHTVVPCCLSVSLDFIFTSSHEVGTLEEERENNPKVSLYLTYLLIYVYFFPCSISESFLTVKGAALFLPRGNGSSTPRVSHRRNKHAGKAPHMPFLFLVSLPFVLSQKTDYLHCHFSSSSVIVKESIVLCCNHFSFMLIDHFSGTQQNTLYMKQMVNKFLLEK